MAWERRGSGLYYYRKHRFGRRCRSEYVGAGIHALAVAEADAEVRAMLRARRQEWTKERKRHRALDVEVDRIADLTQTLLEGLLLHSGYHKHKGQWRKRRG